MLRDHTTFSRLLLALRRRPRRGPRHHRVLVPVCRPRPHPGSEASWALFHRFARRGRRGAALRTHASAAPCYGSQGCPSLACAAGFVQGGSCAHGRVISWPLVPCLPPQLAFYHDAKFVLMSSGLRTDLIFATDQTPPEDVSEGQETVRERFCSSSLRRTDPVLYARKPKRAP